MNPRDLGLILFPGIGLLIIGVIAEMMMPGQAVAALVAMLLTTPAALATIWLMRAMVRRDPRAAVLGMGAGVLIRGTIAVGGACLVYFLTDWLSNAGVAFWFWLSFAYFSNLTAEIVALTRPNPVLKGERDTKG